MKELPDAGDRRDALRDFQHNLVVVAGAGTGKTSLLVGRFLAALTLHHMEPREVLALTFTENAAAEMDERLHRLMAGFETWLEGGEVPESDRHVLASLDLGPEFRGRIAELRQRGEELQIATIHGYCLRLLRESSRILDLPPDLRLQDEDLARRELDLAFVDYLRRQTEVPAALRNHEPRLLREFAWSLLRLPADCWTRVEPDPRPGLMHQRQRLEELLNTHGNARQAWQDAGKTLLDAYDLVLSGRGQPELPKRIPAAGDRELGKEISARAVAAMKEHAKRLRPYVDADPEGVAAAVEFLAPFLTEHRRRRLAAGHVTFDDLLLLTRHHLMGNPQFRRKVGGALKAIMVDEFQDTDPLQYDVIFLLAAREDEEQIRSPMQAPLRPSVLHIVGDAKQSIYRFRRADVAAFGRAVDHVMTQNGRELNLVSNFRSRPPILDLVHGVCSRSLAERRPFQFQYRRVIPTRTNPGGEAVEIFEVSEADGAEARREREGRQIVAVMESVREQGHRDVAVLLRAATDINWLLRPLREARIPYVLEGSKLFYKRHEIVLATAMISSMARPWDPVAVLGVLRSALVGAEDGAILRYLQDAGSLDFSTAQGKGPVAEGLRWLGELHRSVATLPVDRALAHILTHPALATTEGGGFEGAQRLANLDRLLGRLLAVSPLDLQAAADWLARNTATGTQDEESPLFDRGMDALRILTVHGAKGLEFDVVIVPDLARTPRLQEDRVQAQRLLSADGEEIVALQLNRSCNTGAAIARLEAKDHLEAEERRLFYVAATRARERLILLTGDGTGKRALWREDLRKIPGDLGGVVHSKAGSLPAPRGRRRQKQDAQPVIAAFAAHRSLAKSLQEHSPDILSPSSMGEGEVEHHGAPGEFALAVGDAMHRYLAEVDFHRETADESLLDEGLGEEAKVDLLRLTRLFHGSDLRRRLAAANSVWRELPVAYDEESGRTVQGTIDALVLEDDSITVLDYKTDRVTDHAKAAETHRDQLAAYGRGVQRALGLSEPPALEVHFLREDHTHRL